MDEREAEEDRKSKKSSSISPNDVMTTIYDVTRVIFRHLPIRSVDSCSAVCQSWAQMARLTKSQRHTIHTLSYPSNLSYTETPCSHLLSDFEAVISSYVNNRLWSIPSFAFAVATINLEKEGFQSLLSSSSPTRSSKRFRSEATIRRIQRHDISQALVRHLNKSCQVLTISSHGIVATNGECQATEFESGIAMGILLFPKLPSEVFGLYPFQIPSNIQTTPNMSRGDVHRLFGGVPDDIPIRCVILFFRHDASSLLNCMKSLFEFYSSDVALMGGFIDQIHYNDRQSQRTNHSYSTCGITLTGDPNHLTIRQVVLGTDIQTRDAVRDKLKQLKSNESKSCLSFGVQVSCVARGSDFYNDEQNVECAEFQKLFPGVPLIGIFGNGEVGHDFLPNDNQNSPAHTKRTTDSLFHSYSTVVSLVSVRL